MQTNKNMVILPPKGYEVDVERESVLDPVGEGNLANVDEVSGANRVLDRVILELFVAKPVTKRRN